MKRILFILLMVTLLAGCKGQIHEVDSDTEALLNESNSYEPSFTEDNEWLKYVNKEYGFEFYYPKNIKALSSNWGEPFDAREIEFLETDDAVYFLPVGQEPDFIYRGVLFGKVADEDGLDEWIQENFSTSSLDESICILHELVDENEDGILEASITSTDGNGYACTGGVSKRFLYNPDTGTVVYVIFSIGEYMWANNGERLELAIYDFKLN